MSFLFDMNRLMGGTPRGLFVGQQLMACALLEPPSGSRLVMGVRLTLSILRFLPVTLAMPLRVTAFLNEYMKRTRAASPPSPHCYLSLIGVHPDGQGRGFGRRLMMDAFDRSQSHGRSTGIALDTENEANVALYQRWGFRTLASVDLGGVTAHCLFRSAKEFL
ncbi:Histone acetyltransferase HPA2 [Pseudomonas batumici]|uniref:Histone acetyltransferase HPA2 n=1 Tax=Pseudomonas batumici TaxID=226910 RepID=A0A0C2EZC2_9PSED|nr:Histone acetyltransferase HPA2 [Pseudomonas batumici]